MTPLGGVGVEPALVMRDPIVESRATTPDAGRIFALIDRASASSGESAPEALRAALGATNVGERTGGYSEYGNLRPYVMPRTGIVWQLASKRNYYAQPTDGVGLPVDVYLDSDLLEAPVEVLAPRLETIPKKK